MATRRRALRSAVHSNLPDHAPRKNPLGAISPAAKLALVVVGAAGLSALAVAIFGPQRFQKEILAPVQNRVADQASQLWSDSKGLREQIGQLFDRAQSPAGRDKLAKNFQSWVGHFRAT